MKGGGGMGKDLHKMGGFWEWRWKWKWKWEWEWEWEWKDGF